ncbi:MAG: OadG family protein [Clostridium sp.]
MQESIMDKLIFALGVAVVAMLIVFSVLVILNFIIRFQSYIFEKINKTKKKDEKVEEKPKDICTVTEVEEVTVQDDAEIVAAIIGALSLQLDVPASGLNIRSIKRVSNSSWNGKTR